MGGEGSGRRGVARWVLDGFFGQDVENGLMGGCLYECIKFVDGDSDSKLKRPVLVMGSVCLMLDVLHSRDEYGSC